MYQYRSGSFYFQKQNIWTKKIVSLRKKNFFSLQIHYVLDPGEFWSQKFVSLCKKSFPSFLFRFVFDLEEFWSKNFRFASLKMFFPFPVFVTFSILENSGLTIFASFRYCNFPHYRMFILISSLASPLLSLPSLLSPPHPSLSSLPLSLLSLSLFFSSLISPWFVLLRSFCSFELISFALFRYWDI